MRNVLTIARKELHSYFASPLAYVVIGVFAFFVGYFFYAGVVLFDRQSMQISAFGDDQPVNINQLIIGPLFLNLSVVLLFTLPAITARTYAEEKRSGTIELLLTSPLTDVQIVFGKFLGTMALYGAMLAVSLVHVGLLFWLGEPEFLPVLTGYLGLLLMGGCFVAIGLFVSSLTNSQMLSGLVTFAIFLLLLIINWLASFTAPPMQDILNYLAVMDHLEDFTLGVLDTRHLVYYLSVIVLGLYLTVRSVHTERWRG